MPGVLVLNHSLKLSGSKYPLIVLYTATLSDEGLKTLTSHGIPTRRIEYLLPSHHKAYPNDERFYDCWSKLQPFSLFEFDRVVQLDSDMVVVKNMDELMDLSLEGNAFAAAHACVCNPMKKEHYPKDWTATNCAYTHYKKHKSDYLTKSKGIPEQHLDVVGPGPRVGLGICNGGLQVVDPSAKLYDKIVSALNNPKATENYEFADQSLLSDVFEGNWLPLSYKYNALKTLPLVHPDVWDSEEVKNVHYIMGPKPWDVSESHEEETGTFGYWYDVERNFQRQNL